MSNGGQIFKNDIEVISEYEPEPRVVKICFSCGDPMYLQFNKSKKEISNFNIKRTFVCEQCIADYFDVIGTKREKGREGEIYFDYTGRIVCGERHRGEVSYDKRAIVRRDLWWDEDKQKWNDEKGEEEE